MAKPTTSTATPQRGDASGKKRKPPATVAGGGGLRSSSSDEAEHTESIPTQHTTHNPNIDRGETNNRSAQDDGTKKTETPASSRQEERRGSVNRNADFRAEHVFSQIKNDRTLPPNAKYLCLLLVTYMNEYGEASPIVAALAEVTGLNRDTVSKHLKILVDQGWLAVDKVRDDSGRLITVYTWLRNAD